MPVFRLPPVPPPLEVGPWMRAWAARQDQGAAGSSSHTTPEGAAAALMLRAVLGRAPEGLACTLGHWLRRRVEHGLGRPVRQWQWNMVA
eukprot:8775991-Lingulodinium_polyedra.AAC.1